MCDLSSVETFPGSLSRTIKGPNTQTIKSGIFPTLELRNQHTHNTRADFIAVSYICIVSYNVFENRIYDRLAAGFGPILATDASTPGCGTGNTGMYVRGLRPILYRCPFLSKTVLLCWGGGGGAGKIKRGGYKSHSHFPKSHNSVINQEKVGIPTEFPGKFQHWTGARTEGRGADGAHRTRTGGT